MHLVEDLHSEHIRRSTSGDNVSNSHKSYDKKKNMCNNFWLFVLCEMLLNFTSRHLELKNVLDFLAECLTEY